MPIPILILIIAGSSVLLIAGLIVFLFFRSRYIMRKKVASLERENNYLLSLLSGKVANNISRIELISRANLLYVQLISSLRERFKPILDSINNESTVHIEELKKLVQEKEYKGLKKKIMSVDAEVTRIKHEVLSLENDVDEIVRPEEDARSLALEVKEHLRRTKKEFSNHENDMKLVAASFNNIFDNVNDNFIEIDQLIESAEYNEATRNLYKLTELFNELDRVLGELPQICILLSDVLPGKMLEVERVYDEMEKQNYPLRHLRVKGGLAEMENEILSMRERAKELSINGVLTKLNDFNLQLENYVKEFEKERVSKIEFEAIYSNIAEVVESLHKRYIKLSNNLHEVRRYYQINSDHEKRLEELKEQVDDITTIKRNLDTFVHSSSGQHYSLLLFKARQLEEKTTLMFSNLELFKEYEGSLKGDSERAYSLVNSTFFKLFEIKRRINDLVAVSLKEQYLVQVDRSYKTLSELSLSLKSVPIDVEKVNQLMSRLSSIYADVEKRLDYDLKLQSACEVNFVNANIFRSQFSEVNRQMIQIENSFWEGDYQTALQEVSAILKKHGSEISS